jgi:sodium/proline symporter
VLYTFLGGYLAVAYTDFVQAILMLIGVLWILIASLTALGGFAAANARIGELDASLLTMWGKDEAYFGQWGLVIGALLVFSIGYMGWPHVVVRHMAMKRPSMARRAGGYAMIFNLLFVPAPYLVGLLALLLIPIGTDPELAIFSVAQQLLPTAVVGLVMAGIMAAIMSTADSILLQAGTIASRDIFHRFINPNMNEKHMVWVSRGMVLVVAVIGFVVAVVQPPAVFAIVVFATTVLGSAFVPAYVAAVWWRKANTVGAIASMLAGTIVAVGWEILSLEGATGLNSMLVGIVSSVTAMIAGSLLTQKSHPVPSQIQEALIETERIGAIPAALLKGQDRQMVSEAFANRRS